MKSYAPITPHPNIEIIPNRVYFSILKVPHKSQINDPAHSHKETITFCIDTNQEYQYLPFYYDFGPPSLLQIHKFYTKIINLMESHPNAIIHYMCSTRSNLMPNGVLFISAFRMIHLKQTPEEAFSPCENFANSLKPFRDASTMPCQYDLTVLSCLKGLHHAMELGWYDPSTFDAKQWEFIEQVPNGDMNWIIPHKLLAFATPYNTNVLPGGWRVATPEDLVPTFKKLGITHIIRLCEKFYNERAFTRAGFKHTELYFLDGSTPPVAIRENFLQIAEGDDVIALHCKAGLGRTGTLIGCYLIKEHHFTANEVIGWIRICRPGSIIGPQQKYLVAYEIQINKTQIKKIALSPDEDLIQINKPTTAELAPQPDNDSDSNSKDLSSKQKVVASPSPPRHKKKSSAALYPRTKLTSISSNTSANTSTANAGISSSYISPSHYHVNPVSSKPPSRPKPNQITSSKKIIHPGKSSSTSQRSTGVTKRKTEAAPKSPVTPYYPQPRKEKRAAATADSSIRPIRKH